MIKKMIFLFNILLFPTASKAAPVELYIYQDKTTELLGFKDTNDKIVIAAQFERIMAPHEEQLFSSSNKDFQFLVPVIKQEEIWRMTSEGKLKFKTVFFDNGPDYYAEGLARFIENHKIGFHNREGKVVIKPAYDFASPFKNGKANVCNGCHAEYPKMPTYRPLSSKMCEHLREEMYKTVVGGKWGVIDIQGNIIVPLIYDSYEKLNKRK